MAQVDWITWKTDPKEIINPDLMLEDLTEMFQNYHIYMNSVVAENIQYEIKKGGLDEDSLNILGDSPANRKARDIMNRIEKIKQLMETFQKEIYSSAEEQKKIEKEQLIECLEEKLEEEELKKANTIALNERLQGNNSYITKKEVEDIIDITTDRINRLKERIDIARMI